MIKIKQRSYADQNNEHDILQLMRAFGILMVVIQHAVVLYFSTSFSDILITICVFVDVHVFMFVSGYLFQKKRDQYIEMGIKKFALKKFRSLMVPYLFWAGILFLGTYILYGLSDRFGVSKICRSILTFGFGRLFRRYRLERVLIKNWQAFLVALLAFIGIFFYLIRLPLGISEPHIVAIIKNTEIASLGMLGITMVYVVSSYLASYKSKLTRYLLILGDYSLAVYLLHNPWIVHGSHIVFKKLSVPAWLGSAVSIAMGLLLPIWLYKYVIKKSKLLSRLMLGI